MVLSAKLCSLNLTNLFQLKNQRSTPKKKVPVRKNPSNSDYIDDDDDEALRQVSCSSLLDDILFTLPGLG